jgi:SRSO17 transposase
MTAEEIRELEPWLRTYLAQFDDCFARRDTRAHLPVYVRGQLSDLQRKSVEPIALAAGVPVRTLQEFLSQHRWDEDRLRDRLQQLVAQEHGDPQAIGIIDETSAVKQGDKTPGVQRQYLGCVGKQENGIVTVHVGYSAGEFHCLLDGDLFLPESWDQDRDRCRAAGIPDEVRYRPKTEIALELYDRARANGVQFAWLTFDEWYGSKPPFLRALDDRQQKFVGEIHQDVVGWIDPPRITHRRYRRGGRGRGRKTPRLVSGSRPAQTVQQLAAAHPALRDQPWETWRVKDGEKGPIVWQVKHVLLYVKDADRLPSKRYHLLVCRNPLTGETKYFLSNAPPKTPVKTLLAVAFSRWPIERCFEDHKGELGLTHWEGRHWIGLKRHLILTAVSYLFLATACQRLRKKKSRGHGLPGACGRQRGRAVVVAGRGRGGRSVPPDGRDHPVPPTPQRPSAPQPHQSHEAKVATGRH